MNSIRAVPAIVLTLVGSTAVAADFTFNIPLSVENTVIWRIGIQCAVYENELLDDGRMGGTYGVQIGIGSASVDIVDGSFDGTVTVEVDADAGTYPALARSYVCDLQASWPLEPDKGFVQGAGDVTIHPGRFEENYEARSGYLLESAITSIRGRIEQ